MKSRYELLLDLQDELAHLAADPRYARLRQLAEELRKADWAENQGAGGVINELSSMFLENIGGLKNQVQRLISDQVRCTDEQTLSPSWS